MLEALMPMDLHGAADALGVHPFEVVRLAVMKDGGLDRLTVSRETVESLRDFGGLEVWWEEHSLPADENPRRAAVRGVLDQLVQREIVGEKTTRLDNLWRGLDGASREAAEHGVMTLLELGALNSVGSPGGVRVSLHPDQLEMARGVVARGQAPAELAAVWEG